MTDELEITRQVRRFYDQVGWQVVSEGMYQNARYEDLRPVSRDYIHRCHLRVGRFLKPTGRFLLDAGCGPIQYPEYLTYSQGYAYRVCADISITALVEARKRIGTHGLYVVADVANLPFKRDVFEGVVSLHTFHHLPEDDQWTAYDEVYRVLVSGCPAVVVNGWTEAPLMKGLRGLIRLVEKINGRLQRGVFARQVKTVDQDSAKPLEDRGSQADQTGTFVRRINAARFKQQMQGRMPFEIRVWRSVNTRFLRTMIHPWLGGRLWLRLLYWLEERFPAYFGERGQYPMVIIRKAGQAQEAAGGSAKESI